MNVFIRRHAEQYQWFETSGQAVHSTLHQGALDELAAFYQQHQAAVRHWILLLPALDVALCSIPFSEKERRHIRKAIPFLLEDELLSEADDIHFVHGKLAATHVDVAAVDQLQLQARLAPLHSAGIQPDYCIAESCLLPAAEAGWQLFYIDDSYLVCRPDALPVAYESAHLALGMELLTGAYAELPALIRLAAMDEQALQLAASRVPQALQHLLQTEVLDLPLLWQQQFDREGAQWNFLQGRFARNSEWLAKIRPWRWPAAALLLALVLQASLTGLQGRELAAQHAALKQQMDSLFRQVVPQGQIVNHRLQLERLLQSLQQTGGGGGSFIGRINTIGEVLAEHKVQELNALNYEQNPQEIRLDLLVKDYDQLQKIIDGLKAKALTVEIQNSNAQGEQLRARLRISA
ncbi:MAG TPA: type II secretion system protein GspL [Pseudomonadales bacterium]